jgi:hypothetical protein
MVDAPLLNGKMAPLYHNVENQSCGVHVGTSPPPRYNADEPVYKPINAILPPQKERFE